MLRSSLCNFQYGTDADKVLSLVSIPQYFDLEEYGQRRLGKVADLLSAIIFVMCDF